MMGFIVPSSDATLILICGFKPCPPWPRGKSSGLSSPLDYLWKLKVGEKGSGIQTVRVHFPSRAARRLYLGFLLFGKRRNGAGIIWAFALLGVACEQGHYLREQGPSVEESRTREKKRLLPTSQGLWMMLFSL